MSEFVKKEASYIQSLRQLYSLTNYETLTHKSSQIKKNDPEKIAWLAKKMGVLAEKIRTIHIVGTNGKGSTAAMLSSVLIQHGYRVGLFTSPHLHTIRERLCLNNLPIPKNDFVSLFSFMWKSIMKYHGRSNIPEVTVFEFLTLMAFGYFKKKSVNYQIIESGIGGNKDATNIVNAQHVILTSVGFDHTRILGNTLTKIAYDKLGVLKCKANLISSKQSRNVEVLIDDICKKRDVNLVSVGKDIIINSFEAKQKFQFCEIQGLLNIYKLKIPLLGKHQLQNLATVIGTLEKLVINGFKLNKNKLYLGLETVKWPCRLELISTDPVIYVDGAHNPHSIKMLADYFKDKKIIFIFGCNLGKNIKKSFQILNKMNPILIVTRSHHPRSCSPAILAAIARNMEFRKVIETSSISEAISKAKKLASLSIDAIVGTGSLFVGSEVRSIIKDIKQEYPNY